MDSEGRHKTVDGGVPLSVAKLLSGLRVIQMGNMAKCIKHTGRKYNGKGPPGITGPTFI